MGVGATGPLPSPFFSDPLKGPRPLAPATDANGQNPRPGSAQAPLVPGLNPTGNLTASYAQATLSPIGFVLPVKPETLVTQAMKNFDRLDPGERAQLNRLATDLGFTGGRSLAHALRNLPEAKCKAWLQSLPAGTRQPEQIQAARSQLAGLARQSLNQFFTEAKLPPPKLDPPPDKQGNQGLWDPSSCLAVLNSMQELKSSLPDATFRKLAAPGGQALEFERKHQPAETPGGLMQTLSGCMCIACSDGVRKISIYDPAVSMNPKDILKREDVKGLMTRLNQNPPPAADVKSLQEMLNLGLPPNRQLPVNGKMSDAVAKGLADFESVQALKQSLDIVKDDVQLSDKDKKDLGQRIKGLIAQVQGGGAEPAALQQLLSDLGKQKGLSSSGTERLKALQASSVGKVCTDRLRPQQLEMLVSNWFGMIDSGNQYDFTEQVINHEIGHLLQGQDNLMKNWTEISFRDPKLALAGKNEFMSETLKSRASGWGVSTFEKFGLNFTNGFGSDYARVNPQEDFAESFRLFTRHPEQLAQENPLKFVFMAGATGKYAGKEHELVDFLRRQGINDTNLQNLVRILRGQNTAFVTEKTQAAVNSTTQIADKLAKAVIPGLALTTFFGDGKSPIESTGQAVADKLAGYAGKLSDDYTPRFDMSVQTMLPGLEKALGMDTKIRRVLPSQPGYVLDWLTEQCTRVQGADPKARAAAAKVLDDFAQNGINALDPAIRKQLPAAERENMKSLKDRAVILALAHIHAFPQNQQVWADRMHAAGQRFTDMVQNGLDSLNHFASTQAKAPKESNKESGKESLLRKETGKGFSDQQLENLLGKDIAKALPTSFKAMLREPDTIAKITGLFGSISLDSGKLEQEVTTQVHERSAAFQQAANAILDSQKSPLITGLADGCFKPDGQNSDKLVVDEFFADVMMQPLQELVENLAKGSGISMHFTPELGHDLLNKVAARLSHPHVGEQDLSASNPAFKSEVAKALYVELSHRYALRDALDLI